MTTSSKNEIDLTGVEVLEMTGLEILERLKINREGYGEAKRRWQAVWDFDSDLDRWPLIALFPTEKIRRTPGFPPLKDHDDIQKMLWNQIDFLIKRHLVDDDSMPVLTLEEGATRLIPLAFGAHFHDEPDHEPQVVPFIDNVNEVLDWSCPNIAESNAFRRLSEMATAFQEMVGMKGYIVRSCYVGGPFTTAQMMRGCDWFEDLYLAKPAAHRLIELVCEACTQLWNLDTELLNYAADSEGYSRLGAFVPGGAYQMWECSDIMISTEMCQEFCTPYHEKLYKEFGGGMRQLGPEDERLLDVILETKGLKCICPEVINDVDVEKLTEAAHEKGIAVTWTNNGESRGGHYVKTPIKSVVEFKDWIEWIRKQTHHAKTGIGLIVDFSSLEVARKSLEAWKEM